LGAGKGIKEGISGGNEYMGVIVHPYSNTDNRNKQ
jgi:hypothetical protein